MDWDVKIAWIVGGGGCADDDFDAGADVGGEQNDSAADFG